MIKEQFNLKVLFELAVSGMLESSGKKKELTKNIIDRIGIWKSDYEYFGV